MKFQTQLKNQEVFVIYHCHDALCQEVFDSMASSTGYQVTAVTFSLCSLTFLYSSFYVLSLAPLSNWSTFQYRHLGLQKDPVCLSRRQSTQVSSGKRLMLFPACVLVHCPTWPQGDIVFVSLSFQVLTSVLDVLRLRGQLG